MTFGPFAIAVVAVAVLGSSFISGIFGMAGGMILLGALLVFMDVAPAMVLLSVIQTVSNGWRAALWLRYVDWNIVWRFVIGSSLAFVFMRSVALLPSKATVYLTLGLLPFAAELLPKRVSLDIARPRVAYTAGALILVLQLFAGAAGHILDVFFQRSPLDRKRIVATKAVTQVSGHLYRVLYFGSFAASFDATIAWWEYLAAIALSLAGTSLAAAVLMRMTDGVFRIWSRRVTLGVCVAYLARWLWLVAVP
ncbi:MAG: sulfite exporter TauE/SafE family protein [Hyphomicrobiaceae bacterium]|nr:sulfite exporter TauE/SafE family protein [Hyphomicrobiaceae bacterium]